MRLLLAGDVTGISPHGSLTCTASGSVTSAAARGEIGSIDRSGNCGCASAPATAAAALAAVASSATPRHCRSTAISSSSPLSCSGCTPGMAAIVLRSASLLANRRCRLAISLSCSCSCSCSSACTSSCSGSSRAHSGVSSSLSCSFSCCCTCACASGACTCSCSGSSRAHSGISSSSSSSSPLPSFGESGALIGSGETSD